MDTTNTGQGQPKGALRDRMPTVAGWVDELRAAFGADEVDAWIRTGLRKGGFYASEHGHAVGVSTWEKGT